MNTMNTTTTICVADLAQVIYLCCAYFYITVDAGKKVQVVYSST